MSYIYNLGLDFYQISSKHPDNLALICNDQEYTFSHLNELSNKIARYLINTGFKKGDVAGIFHNKTVLGFSFMLACLKTGIVYVNLDYHSPDVRLTRIIERCQPKIIFNSFNLDNKFFLNIPQISEATLLKETEQQIPKNLDFTNSISGEDPAYIMFTSGSTGFPKGAVMTHANLLNFIKWGKNQYQVQTTDRFTNVNPLYFDNSVFDFYISLFNGASLVSVSYDTVKIPQKLVEAVDKHQCTIWFSVPSLLVYLLTLRLLSEETFSSLRIISFGGEGFPKPKLRELFNLYNQKKIVNVYGPTECTCICSAYDITKKDITTDNHFAPLGYLSPNFDYELLDYDSSTQTGELFLLGPQVGKGYYNDHPQTEKSFVQSPSNKNHSKIGYKTGDLVKEDEQGLLHFVARVDNQIKYMGYRIELEEIEAAFYGLDYINEAAVIYEKTTAGISTGGIIKAFVSLSDQKERIEIMNDVKKVLPSYMLPKMIEILEIIPKNKNGKIDKNALKEISNS